MLVTFASFGNVTQTLTWVHGVYVTRFCEFWGYIATDNKYTHCQTAMPRTNEPLPSIAYHNVHKFVLNYYYAFRDFLMYELYAFSLVLNINRIPRINQSYPLRVQFILSSDDYKS